MTGPIADLGKYFGHPLKAPGPGASNIAKMILMNADTSKAMGPGSVQSNSPSVMSRLFDILSRPNYAIANVVKGEFENHDNPIADFLSGLSGTQKTTFDNVLQTAGVPDSPARNIAGLAGDIFLDPTTYIPGGQIGKLKNIFKGAEEVTHDLPAAEKIIKSGSEAVNPELYGLPTSANKDIPTSLVSKPDIPNLPNPSNLEPKPGFTVPQQALDLRLPDRQAILDGEIGASAPITQSRINIPDALKPTSPPVGLEKDLSAPVKGQIGMSFRGMPLKDMKKAGEDLNLENAQKIVAGTAQGDIREALKMIPIPKPVAKASERIEAQRIVDNFHTDKATAIINKQYPDTLNAKQQLKLWYKSREAVEKSVRRSNPTTGVKRDTAKIEQEIVNKTFPIYHEAEQILMRGGRTPRIGTGENVKLSDVLADLMLRKVPITGEHLQEFGTKINKTSEVGGAVERLRARGAIDDSAKINSIVDNAVMSKSAAKSFVPMSDHSTMNFDKFVKRFSKDQAKVQGVSPAGIRTQNKLINLTLDAGKSPAQITQQHMAKELEQVISTGKTNGHVTQAVTHSLEKDIGKLPGWAQNDNKAVEFLMGRVSTTFGQADLRPMSLIAAASAQSTAAARAKVLANMFRGFDKAQRLEAFKAAQGLGQSVTEATARLSMDIQNAMSDLAGQVAGSSVLLRSGVPMEELNRWMKKYGTGFQFSKGEMKNPVTGEIIDFSKNTDWVNSWKMHDISQRDPAQFMFQVMQAMEQSVREKSLFDEIGERFGSQIAGKDFTNKVNFPYLAPYYFPKDVLPQIARVIKDWHHIGSTTQNQMLKLYDRGLSMWKSSATIYRPGFHIRNFVGDMYLGMLDGVMSVTPYKLALQVQRSMRGAYKEMADVDKMVELGIVKRGVETPVPGKRLFTNKSGVPFTAEQISAVAHEKGLLEHYKSFEDIIDAGAEGKGISPTRPFGGKVQRFAGGIAEMQSHNARLAHFIDKVQKSRGNDLVKIFGEAAQRARKFHPSGIDMTHFEKTVMRRIIPFYSWIRKSSPLLLEGIVMRPGVTVLPSKINQTMQEIGGIQNTDRGNPFPTDQMFPSWLRNEGIGPISVGGDSLLGKLSNQSTPGYTQFGVGLNPLSQLLAQFQDPSKTVGSSLSPALQMPIELISGHKIFTGEPITGVDAKPNALAEWLGSQIPAASAFQGLTGIGLAGETNKSKAQGGDLQKEALVNWITGLGIKGTGPYIKSAKYELTAPIKQQQKAAKADFLSNLRDQMGG